MSKYENFWIVTILRGVLAILIGSAIFVVPDMARTLLFLPFAVAFVILSLVVYGIVDSVLVFVTSFFLSLRLARFALRLQSAVCLGIGILFCSILFNWIRLEWFLYLIALQAFTTAYAEVTIARHTSAKLGSRCSYARGDGCPALCHDLRDCQLCRPCRLVTAADRLSRLCLPGRLRGRPDIDGCADALSRAPYEPDRSLPSPSVCAPLPL